MRLHYYAPPVRQSYCVGIHNGHGFGSLFAKLFSKVAAKTAARAAVSVAKSAGKKAVTFAAKQGAKLVKEAAKEGLKQAADIGTELATAKINSLAESAIKKNLPPEVVHSIRDIATRGVGAAGTAVQTVGTDKVQGLIDKGSAKAERLGNRLIDKGENLIERRIIDRLPSSSVGTTSAAVVVPVPEGNKRKKKSQSSEQKRGKKRKVQQQRSPLTKNKKKKKSAPSTSSPLANHLDEA